MGFGAAFDRTWFEAVGTVADPMTGEIFQAHLLEEGRMFLGCHGDEPGRSDGLHSGGETQFAGKSKGSATVLIMVNS
jgi:hypothetical protein